MSATILSVASSTATTKVAPDPSKPAAPPKPSLSPVANMSPEQIDQMDSEALKAALKSIIRSPGASMLHKDHRSFSSGEREM